MCSRRALSGINKSSLRLNYRRATSSRRPFTLSVCVCVHTNIQLERSMQAQPFAIFHSIAAIKCFLSARKTDASHDKCGALKNSTEKRGNFSFMPKSFDVLAQFCIASYYACCSICLLLRYNDANALAVNYFGILPWLFFFFLIVRLRFNC